MYNEWFAAKKAVESDPMVPWSEDAPFYEEVLDGFLGGESRSHSPQSSRRNTTTSPSTTTPSEADVTPSSKHQVAEPSPPPHQTNETAASPSRWARFKGKARNLVSA